MCRQNVLYRQLCPSHAPCCAAVLSLTLFLVDTLSTRFLDLADIVRWLLPRLPESALVAQNDALSTPLHWIALNYHLAILELVCPLVPLAAFEIKNQHGKTAVQEAEEACEAFVVGEADQETDKGRERVRREKCVAYLLGCMGLGVKKPTGGHESKAEEADGDVTAAGEGQDDETVKRLTEQAEKIKLEQEAQAKQA